MQPSDTSAINASSGSAPAQSLLASLRAFLHPRVITMLFLGFSAGIPILLIFSSLSLWLREAGVEKSAVTFFSWAALGYSFKFIWAPLVDRLPLPILTACLGRRRGWMLLSQFAVIASLAWMATTDPSVEIGSLTAMAMAAVALGFSSATQDIVIDAYRIDSAGDELQALMSSTYIAGYRIGMLAAGAGALYLADFFGSSAEVYNYTAWRNTYLSMGGLMLIGVITTLIISEPASTKESEPTHHVGNHLRFFVSFLVAVVAFILVYRLSGDIVKPTRDYLTELLANKNLARLIVSTARLTAALLVVTAVSWLLIRLRAVDGRMVGEAYVIPVKDFFTRYGKTLAILLLLLVGFYRVSDIVLGVIANVFYQDMGFTKTQIASVSKVFGLWMTIIGGFLGGLLAVRYGVMRILLLGAILSAGTNLLFILLANSETGGSPDINLLFIVIGADNLSAGLASAAFIAFLSSLTNVSFTAVQYAIFSSLMTLFPKVLGGYSGGFVESMGYANFFIMTTLLSLPVLILILITWRYFDGRVKCAD